jgi:dTDP-4-amino-4,6-dideoxygalactose transaminase
VAGEYAVIEQFERRLAELTGAPHVVAVDTCTAAIFLCCVRLRVGEVTLPARTYPSVPCAVIHAGGRVRFVEEAWQGEYQLRPYPLWDSALRLRRGMYRPGHFQCLSFQYRKRLAIGRGGAILTDDAEAAAWLRLARFNGREAEPVGRGRIHFAGWHLFMEPERAARGLTLMTWLRGDEPDLVAEYPDLSQVEAFR